jgi:hypothetical protein
MTAKSFSGGCQCGKVKFEVTVDPENAVSCNCSRCSKVGWLVTFAAADQFKLLAGEGETTDFQFHRKNIHHLFCKTCGIESYARGTAPNGASMVAINVRCLDGVDVSALKPKMFDGLSL